MATSFSDLPAIEQLAIKQALWQELGADMSTKDADSLRGTCDAKIISAYNATGAKSYDVRINGEKVGTYSVRVTKGKDAESVKRLVIHDPHELEQFIQSGECADEVIEYAQLLGRNFAEYMLETHGVICKGCEVVDELIPAKSPSVAGTTLRIDRKRVASTLVGYLPTTVAGLLGSGDDE